MGVLGMVLGKEAAARAPLILTVSARNIYGDGERRGCVLAAPSSLGLLIKVVPMYSLPRRKRARKRNPTPQNPGEENKRIPNAEWSVELGSPKYCAR